MASCKNIDPFLLKSQLILKNLAKPKIWLFLSRQMRDFPFLELLLCKIRPRKAREILDNWKNWSTSINNLKQDCARINVGNLRVKQDGLSSKRNQESDDDFQPLKTPSTKQRKQLSLPKKNKKLVKLIASKKAKTTCRNVDERGNDDDPSLSNENSNSRSSTSSTSQTQRTS
ncbi:hypothetical protein RhiirA5_468178 [Rhizophagus irregularis]|uniref:Uncharacterized protein n=1 Tax=Rhizophagus irregularis TaxID=588596 RepID=A0A2N0QCP2_9GLOM|nr:hypothetical protein RhiirA5_468178 [Rhizophagus irregularis]